MRRVRKTISYHEMPRNGQWIVISPYRTGDRGQLRYEMPMMPVRFWSVAERRMLWMKKTRRVAWALASVNGLS